MTGMTPAFFCPAGFDQWANCLRNVTETKFTMKSLTGDFADQRFLPIHEEPSARRFPEFVTWIYIEAKIPVALQWILAFFAF